ncbi:taurine ABC transporter permease [Afifella sp. IM 167]|nr:taurine ABC transporter permease [Afifella sp. IM 167]
MAWLRPVISISVPLLIWELASRLGWINSFLFPPPSQILTALWVQAGPQGRPPYAIFYHVFASMMRIVIGVGLALVVGTVVGMLIALTAWGRAIFRPIISAIMPVPTLAWTPVLLLVFGIDNRTTITVVLIATSFEIIYNVVAGLDMLSKRVFWVARSMGASHTQTFFKVIVPGVLPYLITGLRIGIGFAWRALIAAEMLAASSYGLGFMIFDAAEYFNIDIIFGGIMLIAILGLLLENVVLGRLEAATIKRWGVQVER